ncbi:hypothetical protein [Propionibacterium australiense]|uniref:hypothetical protein n=1 Tax=Propionibacterium australiense TaxID=119981 RepID=UPI0018D4EE63|nr:hypothetical protein [Propionibacterium australiense]
MSERPPLSRLRLAPLRLVQFAATQLVCCVFPIPVFVGLAATVLLRQRSRCP